MDRTNTYEPELSIVATLARNHAIGLKGQLPWGTIDTVDSHFRALSEDQVLVMGRKTFELFERPLETRTCVVASTARDVHPGVITVASRNEAIATGLDKARNRGCACYVIGGLSFFEDLMDPFGKYKADKLHITWIDEDFTGDRFFPTILGTLWDKVDSGPFWDRYPLEFTTYERRQ